MGGLQYLGCDSTSPYFLTPHSQVSPTKLRVMQEEIEREKSALKGETEMAAEEKMKVAQDLAEREVCVCHAFDVLC